MPRTRGKISPPIKNISKVLQCILQVLLMTFLMTTLFSVSTIRNNNVESPFLNRVDTRLEDLSSVDYYACCGLGHRLIRLSLAYYVAKMKGFALRSFWGWCGEKAPVEVFSYLFEPQPEEELRHVRSQHVVIPFYNEVPGFVAVGRNPNSTVCPCHQDKIDSDLELYTSLRNRFRNKDRVDSYVRDNFQDRTVIGIHVRAGNGEEGDFVRKGRAIDNPRIWVQHVSQELRDFLKKEQPSLPPALYIATDTPSMVAMFREEWEPANIPVLECPQQGRKQEGQGVLFGVSDKVHNKDGNSNDDYSSCLQDWTNTLTDMFLLSFADVVVAAKPSSFSQTAPMSLAFGNRRRTLSKAYCEVIPGKKENTATNTTVTPTLQCYDSYQDWCCNYPTWITFKHHGPQGRDRVHSKEFVKFLSVENRSNFSKTEYRAMRHRMPNCPRPRRGRAGGGLKDKCLPHQW